MESTKKNKLTKSKKIIIIILSIVLLTISGTCIYIYSILSTIEHTDISKPPVSATEPLPGSTKEEVEELVPLEEPKQIGGGVVNIALFGLDRRGSERCRTDTMMILSIDKDNRKIKLTSLMRDMYVEIPGKWKDRINAAYAYGGPGLAINTINRNFDMDIRYYASVDFKGVQALIDKLGGTDIDLKEGEIIHINSDSKNQIETAGIHHLDGEQTLAYMRIRRFGNGDYERTERQRRVLTQLFDKVKIAGILKFTDLVSTVLPYVETNMSKTEIMGFGVTCLNFSSNIEQYRLPAEGTYSDQYIRGMAVLVPDIEANTKQLHSFIYNRESVSDVDCP